MNQEQSTDLRTRPLLLLSEGFKEDFASRVFESEKFTDLLQELAIDFIDSNIPIVSEDDKFELGLMLLETIRISTY